MQKSQKTTTKKAIDRLQSEYSFRFKKSLGQNFLIDSSWAAKIAAQPTHEQVLEIGPGGGALTEILLENRRKVVAIEYDKTLAQALKTTFRIEREQGRLIILEEDILETELDKLCLTHFNGGVFSVISNLPYNISAPAIIKLLEGPSQLEDITLTIQKEVAERLRATPGTKAYGALTIHREYHGTIEQIGELPPSAFYPMPKVHSAVIKITKHKAPILGAEVSKNAFFSVVKASFAQRRKTLENALSNGGIAKKEKIRGALEQMGLRQDIRGERLTMEEFHTLTKIVTSDTN